LGHKVHPIGFRLGVVKGWQSRWYAERDYKDLLAEDILLRKLIHKELANAAISRIEIERAAANQVSLTVYTAKPGIVIGKSGEKVEKLKALLEAKTKKRVRLNIQEIRQPELDAYLVGRSIAEQLEKRVSFRRAMKQAVQKSMRANAKGIRIVIGGRLGGAEIARTEKEVEGKIPLHTLRADIDYGLTEAHTTFGVIGIKVWIYKGDILPSKRRESAEMHQEATAQPSFTSREREGSERRGERSERRRSAESVSGPRGDRGERGGRPQGQGGERAPRGERTARPQGERPIRPQDSQGERPPRPQGERATRSQGERAQGQAAQSSERTPRVQRPQGERTERPPRPQGERAARLPRTDRPERTQTSPETQAVSEIQIPAVQDVQETQPALPPPAPETTETADTTNSGETGISATESE
jgi:small subunit ribosomal protein S3